MLPGITVWICTENLKGGDNFRDGIAKAVKNCDVFLPLLNEEWAVSEECKIEFNFAYSLNLNSTKKGRSKPGEPRLPVIIPISFPNINWDDHIHVELLAANTNFIMHNTALFEDDGSDMDSTLFELSQAFKKLGFKVNDDLSLNKQVSIVESSNTKLSSSENASKKIHITKESFRDDEDLVTLELEEELRTALEEDLQIAKQELITLKEQANTLEKRNMDDFAQAYVMKYQQAAERDLEPLDDYEMGIAQVAAESLLICIRGDEKIAAVNIWDPYVQEYVRVCRMLLPRLEISKDPSNENVDVSLIEKTWEVLDYTKEALRLYDETLSVMNEYLGYYSDTDNTELKAKNSQIN